MRSENHILKVSGITKYFKGLCALDDVTFSVKKGSIKAIIGPNGAGKTTLMNVINGIIRADKGKIFLNSKDITHFPIDVISRLGITRTFQIVRLFTVGQATVIDNVMIGAHGILRPRILDSFLFRKRLLEQDKRLLEKAYSLISFVGLEGLEMRPATSLSLGNQRLLELARALMADPQLILLDEPASGLNDFEVEHLKKILFSLNEKGLTVVIVEHNVRLVMDIAHEIVVLNFGKKIAEGTAVEIANHEEVLEAYLGKK